ncbi:SpoIIE family protein phosphatase [Butyrivibrio sp. YAB3001]|uniref:SpoIIE family protein phosphatase n=1 Tax=Butyrivibrio sp. YAB3001 TaxID=1520812 RepID=UPI00158824E3|nr:SpoIIE family protein phosphatase [Butyrivibrio sp. YAB3001]
MKNRKKASKGLQKKVFRLCIMLVITAICGFAIMGMIQLRTLLKMANETGQTQAKTVRAQSETSMMQMAEESMKNMAFQAADNTDWEMWELRSEAVLLAAQAEDIFRHPENYGECLIDAPKKENAGKLTLQLMLSDWASPTQEDMVMVRKLANLAPMMEQMIRNNEYNTQDLIISLPNGVSLFMDITSEQKFDENGKLLTYDSKERPWWQQAVEQKDVVLTHAVHSTLLNKSEIDFGVPIYLDGKLMAVVESSVSLDTFQNFVSEVTIGDGLFSIVVSNDGKLVYSPFDEGELKMDQLLSTDIVDLDNDELDALLQRSFKGELGFSEVTINGKRHYVAYAPMITTKWAQLLFMEKEILEEPTEALLAQMDETSRKTIKKYEKSFRQSSWLTIIVMILLVTNAILVAMMFSGKLTNPINRMTEAVGQIEGDNFKFEMDDIYRTGDEIELLAETFGELSERTKKYIREIMEITAEKERIGAELSVAAKIQQDMLPQKFPLYPDRKEFELYASMDPAKEVGGDFYDIFMIDENHLALVMADVSGKGIPASLFMVISKTLLKNRSLLGGSPSEIITDVNRQLCEGNKAAMFVTVCFAIVTLSTGEVVETNAGHEKPLLLIESEGEKTAVREVGTEHDVILGGIRKARFHEDTFMMKPGEQLFIYTDGVTEAKNKEGTMYGMKRLMEALDRNKSEDPKELLHKVREDIDRFVEGADQFDDLTMLSFKYRGM